MKESILVSVILPVFNAEEYIEESIKSILNQTYTNFELIILNDASTDRSEEKCLIFKDSRIKYFYHKNMGLAPTLNKGIDLSSGKYIVRQDADDISHPQRIAKQIDYLEQNNNVLLLGTRAKIFSKTNSNLGLHKHAIYPSLLKFDLLFDNPFVHSSVVLRKDALKQTGNYNIDRNYFEDFDLWSRLSSIGDVANLSDVLVDYRHHEKGISKGTGYYNGDALFNQSVNNIESLMGYKSPLFIQIAALYHKKRDVYEFVSKKEVMKCLAEISEVIKQSYPKDSQLISKRLKQYQKIILSRINFFNRIKQGYLKIFLSKLQNVVLRSSARIKND